MKIAYEPHPVSPERKAELRAQGFKIIDKRFQPKHLIEEKPPVEEGPKGNPTKSEVATMKKSECVDFLVANGVGEPDGTVIELRAMVREFLYSE